MKLDAEGEVAPDKQNGSGSLCSPTRCMAECYPRKT